MNATERTANLRLALERLDNAGKLRAAENLREEAISILEPITPPGYDLKNFDHAVVFWLESRHPTLDWLESFQPLLQPIPIQDARDLLNGYIEPFRGAFELLRACTESLETGKVEQRNINWICDSYTKINAAKEKETLLKDYLPKAEIKSHLGELLSKCGNIEDGKAYQYLTPQTIETQRQQKTTDKNNLQKEKENFICREGICWEVGYKGETATIPNFAGMSYIATLIKISGNPSKLYKSISCQELYQAVSGKGPDNIMSESAAIGEGLNNIGKSKQVINDSEAQQSYGKKLLELKNDIQNAESEMERQEIEEEMNSVIACLDEKTFPDKDKARFQINIKKRIDKTYEALNKAGMKEMAKYLKYNIKPDGAYGLSYLGSATWEIIK